MPINANITRNTMNQFNSNSLRHQGENAIVDTLDTLLSILMFIIMAGTGFVISMMDKTDKKPVLPFTTHDICSSTSVSVSPTYGNTIRRVSSSDGIITSV
jgi:hypothetical protein